MLIYSIVPNLEKYLTNLNLDVTRDLFITSQFETHVSSIASIIYYLGSQCSHNSRSSNLADFLKKWKGKKNEKKN